MCPKEERKAVELYAMQVARKFYEDDGWKVVDKSNSQPFDFLASKGRQQRFIEVKGSTGDGNSVILTNGEVEHVKCHSKESVLMVVAKIQLEGDGHNWAASGGFISTHHDPWLINESKLNPTQFRYEI